MRVALKDVAGVGTIDIAAGTDDFTVNYDGSKIKPAEIVDKLVAGGEKGAKVKS